jgi:hemerythrin-like domain-containing protein
MTEIAEDLNADKSPDTEDIEHIVDFLKTFADKCHHGKEETVLLPELVLTGIPKENGPINVMHSEHVIGRQYIKIGTYLADFRSGDSNSAGLLAASLLDYVNLLENPIAKKENVLFPMAEGILCESKQKEVSDKFDKIVEDVDGHGLYE